MPLELAAALRSIVVAEGLKVELAAAEPAVIDPVALAFDEAGRMYVAENRGYPTGPGEGKEPAGLIARLEDRDRDGYYETRTVFASGFSFPNGLMPWKGGLLVTCAPDVFYLKDSDGDGRADIRRVVLTGFGLGGSTQLRVSHPTLGVDNWIYLTSGLTGGKVSDPLRPGQPPIEFRSDSRFRMDPLEFEPVDGRAQFGLTFDEYGRRFICMNRVQVQHVVLPSRYLRRNLHLAFSDSVQDCPVETEREPLRGHGSAARIYPISRNVTTADSHAGTFTAACGVLVYRGTALPAGFRGCVFSCDPTGNLVHGDRLTAAGATFAAHPIRPEILASTDNWFRPVNLAHGPDGALYICDMYRRTIEHPEYLPVEIRKRTDFQAGNDRGRIYRLTGARPSRREEIGSGTLTTLAGAGARQLARELNNPNGWRQDTAQRLLLERRDPQSVPLLRALVRRAGSAPGARVRGLHLLEALGALDDETLAGTSRDGMPAVREQALELIEPRLKSAPDRWLDRVLDLAKDSDARVRFRAALVLGESDHENTIEALADIAWRDGQDRWARVAVLSSIGRAPDRFAEVFMAKATQRAGRDTVPEWGFLFELGRVLGAGLSPERIGSLLEETVFPLTRFSPRMWIVLLSGISDGARGRADAADIFDLVRGKLEGATEPADPEAGRRFARVLETAVATAADAALRVTAIRLLGHAEHAVAGAALTGLIRAQEPPEIQAAAVRALAQLPETSGLAALLDGPRWRAYGVGVRETILATCFSQPRLLRVFLEAIEAGSVPISALDANRRNQLLKHRDEAIRSRAELLLRGGAPEDRMRVYQEWKETLKQPGRGSAGREVFRRLCASCHRLDREGVAVGPDLFGIRNQPKEVILLHILVPEYEIAPNFSAYELTTRDGRTLTGLITSETASFLTLRSALGEEESLRRSEIESLSSSALSLMPQGLEQTMSRQEMADLIAYLKGEGE